MNTDGQHTPPTFLPLPSSFDPLKSTSWQSLSRQIEEWLTEIVVDTESPEWVWGREAFWMSFVAAYPSFPHGNWPRWNAKIPFDGSFIQMQMSAMQGSSTDGNDSDSEEGSVGLVLGDHRVLSDIWFQFKHLVSTFCPDSSLVDVLESSL
jgi:hypothetical protein